jgi:hypothetical protein
MGGCAGIHGEPGLGGGASIGLLVWDSIAVLDASQVISAKGGNGGAGGNGSAGGLGSEGASGARGSNGDGIGSGGHGGKGGSGGNAGAGSGGTGGPSYAVVFHGTKPTELNGTTVLVRQPGGGGAKGQGGAIGTSRLNPAPDGTDGASAPRLEAKP